MISISIIIIIKSYTGFVSSYMQTNTMKQHKLIYTQEGDNVTHSQCCKT